ncbi:MAG: rRNA maturation RNase YbeY [Candidatus Omnitrophica bacterium]|nr:rRNA maturation RNase YbeY [Candidatus Omnitrophota bacterium]
MKIIIKNLQKKIPINPKRIKTAILKACSLEDIKKSGEVTICFINDEKIKALNSRYLGKNYPTDCLAFDMSRGHTLCADIAISTDTASSNAKRFNTTREYELYLYLVHGLLHLYGYDDKTTRQKRIMENRAISILGALKINK